MVLEEILLTGVETGGTAGTKINASIVEVNKLIAPQEVLNLIAHHAEIDMHIDGEPGSVGQINMINEKTNRDAATIQYNSDDETFYFSVMNKNTGAWRTLLDIKNDGTASIGNGMVQHQIATLDDITNVPNYFDIQAASTADINTLRTEGRYIVGSGSTNRPPHTQYGTIEVSTDELNNEMYQVFQSGDSFKSYERHSDGASTWDAWVETKISSDLGFVTYNMTKKADKTSLPTIFSGEVEPANTLGKDLDWYHRFEAGQSNVVDLYDDVSEENYSPWGFFLLIVDYGDVIEVYPSDRAIFIDTVNNTTLPTEDLKLTIEGNVIPLTIVSNGAGSMVAVYDQTWDAVIENVSVGTAFKITATEGVLTDKEYDYQKHNGEWFRTDFLNTEKVETIIADQTPSHLFGTTDPVDTDGEDGDIYFHYKA